MSRIALQRFLEKKIIQNSIIGLILFNSVIIGLETSPTIMSQFGFIIDQIDLLILGLFVLELILKIYAYRLAFFKSAWNIF
jgi:voltage-gated sodium channel